MLDIYSGVRIFGKSLRIICRDLSYQQPQMKQPKFQYFIPYTNEITIVTTVDILCITFCLRWKTFTAFMITSVTV